MITEKEIIKQIKNNVIAVLNSTGLIRILKVGENTSSGTTLQVPDLSIDVQTGGGSKYTLVFEIKSTGQPRFARMAVNQLKEMVSKNSNYYGVFAAPFISEESRKICQENNIGFIDIGGNCFFKFDNVYLSIEGKSNPFPNTRPLKTLFYSKSSRALRVLLYNPRQNWFVKDLSKEADISIGQAFLVKKKLLEEEFLEELQVDDQKKFKLIKPDKLLGEWGKNYNYKKNNIRNYYSLDDIKTIEDKIANYCNVKKINYAFTLTSGASLVAPFLRYNRAFVYILDNIEKIAKDLDFKEVPSGSNISILQPYDEGVFYKGQVIDGAKVVSDIQLYLDLISYRERGEEAAKFLLEQRISKSW